MGQQQTWEYEDEKEGDLAAKIMASAGIAKVSFSLPRRPAPRFRKRNSSAQFVINRIPPRHHARRRSHTPLSRSSSQLASIRIALVSGRYPSRRVMQSSSKLMCASSNSTTFWQSRQIK